MNSPDLQPVARSRWSPWCLAAAMVLEAAWIVLLTVLAVVH
jgi:hypothetical protein